MERMVGGLAKMFIEGTLEHIREQIISAGFERWVLEKYEAKYQLPDPNLFQCRALVVSLLFTGASQFVTRHVRYDVSTSKVIFDVFIPKLFFSIGDANLDVTLCGHNVDGQLKGWVTVIEPRITGEVGLIMNDEGQMSFESVDLNFSVKDIQSKVTLIIWGMDFSKTVNDFLSKKLQELINIHANKFKDVIEALFNQICGAKLAQMGSPSPCHNDYF